MSERPPPMTVAFHSLGVPEGSAANRRGSPLSMPPMRSAAPYGRVPPRWVFSWMWSVTNFVSVSTPTGSP